MGSRGNSNFLVSLSVFIVYAVGFLSDIFNTKSELVRLWPNVEPFLPLITLFLGIFIGFWFVFATVRLIWRWFSPRRKTERFKLLRLPILESMKVLETIQLHEREYWDAVRTIRDKLTSLNIDCPEIEFPIFRKRWVDFLAWHAALAESGNLAEARTIMKEHGYSRIISATEDHELRLAEISRELEVKHRSDQDG